LRLYLDGALFTGSGAEVHRDGDRYQLVLPSGPVSVAAVRRGNEVLISYRGTQYKFATQPARAGGPNAVGTGSLVATIPGLVVDVRTRLGETVSKGETLVVVEAMKTQQPFVAPFDGVVKDVPVTPGMQVEDGTLLVRVEAV
jgi:biotin carboxyl carrier protein